MGRKSSAKDRSSSADKQTPPPARAGSGPLVLGGVIAVAVVLAVVFFWRGSDSSSSSTASASSPSAPSAAQPAGDAGAGAVATPGAEQSASRARGAAAQSPAEIEASAAATAALGPHKQAVLPPIPFAGYAPPRPPEVVNAAFAFAAEHPEVLSYIPCFCGCEHSGHRGNHDCFVRSRAANGDVLQWEEHGVECAVCIDVATRSRQMHAAGASVGDIRAAIEREYAAKFPQTHTPTPKPPAHSSH
jgi:hypothetical protein